MLGNAEEGTVQAIVVLLERVIFNPNLVKIWFRYSSDVVVLDATIAHLFQGAHRPPYTAVAQCFSEVDGEVIPSFKIKSPFFNQERPPHLDSMSHNDATPCAFHESCRNPKGLPRPCASGNIDILTLFYQLRNSVGYQNPTPRGLFQWFDKNISNLSYAQLLQICIGAPYLHDLLVYFKDAQSASCTEGLSDSDSKAIFFETLRPGMEVNDRAMGYNIGDVVGLGLIMKMLTQSD